MGTAFISASCREGSYSGCMRLGLPRSLHATESELRNHSGHGTEHAHAACPASAGLDPEEEADVRDLFAEKALGSFKGSWTGAVDLHDVRMVRITPKAARREHSEWRPWVQHRALHDAVRAQLPDGKAYPDYPLKLQRAQQQQVRLTAATTAQ